MKGAEILRVASLYNQKFAALEALKKSLLHQAFPGSYETQCLLVKTQDSIHNH